MQKSIEDHIYDSLVYGTSVFYMGTPRKPHMTQTVNHRCILIAGKSASGKTASLRNIKKPQGVLYLNCEAGKEMPFATNDAGEVADFAKVKITHPKQVEKYIKEVEKEPECHTVVIDTLTYLMDMYESVCVLTASNTMKAWGEYAQYFKRLMQQHVAASTKNIIFLAHTMDVLNESEMIMETLVKVKGSLMNQGIESYFNNVVASKKVPLAKLEECSSPFLTITPDEEALGFKYVFQTRLTRETVNDRIRGPMGLWTPEETYIDNDVQLLMNKLHAYYTIVK
jgi:hypothetical protein